MHQIELLVNARNKHASLFNTKNSNDLKHAWDVVLKDLDLPHEPTAIKRKFYSLLKNHKKAKRRNRHFEFSYLFDKHKNDVNVEDKKDEDSSKIVIEENENEDAEQRVKKKSLTSQIYVKDDESTQEEDSNKSNRAEINGDKAKIEHKLLENIPKNKEIENYNAHSNKSLAVKTKNNSGYENNNSANFERIVKEDDENNISRENKGVMDQNKIEESVEHERANDEQETRTESNFRTKQKVHSHKLHFEDSNEDGGGNNANSYRNSQSTLHRDRRNYTKKEASSYDDDYEKIYHKNYEEGSVEKNHERSYETNIKKRDTRIRNDKYKNTGEFDNGTHDYNNNSLESIESNRKNYDKKQYSSQQINDRSHKSYNEDRKFPMSQKPYQDNKHRKSQKYENYRSGHNSPYTRDYNENLVEKDRLNRREYDRDTGDRTYSDYYAKKKRFSNRIDNSDSEDYESSNVERNGLSGEDYYRRKSYKKLSGHKSSREFRDDESFDRENKYHERLDERGEVYNSDIKRKESNKRMWDGRSYRENIARNSYAKEQEAGLSTNIYNAKREMYNNESKERKRAHNLEKRDTRKTNGGNRAYDENGGDSSDVLNHQSKNISTEQVNNYDLVKDNTLKDNERLKKHNIRDNNDSNRENKDFFDYNDSYTKSTNKKTKVGRNDMELQKETSVANISAENQNIDKDRVLQKNVAVKHVKAKDMASSSKEQDRPVNTDKNKESEKFDDKSLISVVKVDELLGSMNKLNESITQLIDLFKNKK